MNVFAKNIRMALVEKSMTQSKLADILGIKHGNFSRKLSINNMCEKDMHAIANALDMDLVIELRHKKGVGKK